MGGGTTDANPLHYRALPLTVWCEVTNASMWITQFLAFYSQVSATVATQASTRLARPGAAWYGRQKLLLVKLATRSMGLGLFGGCACEWVLYVYSACSSGGGDCCVDWSKWGLWNVNGGNHSSPIGVTRYGVPDFRGNPSLLMTHHLLQETLWLETKHLSQPSHSDRLLMLKHAGI